MLCVVFGLLAVACAETASPLVIDFGTAHVTAAVWDDSGFRVLVNATQDDLLRKEVFVPGLRNRESKVKADFYVKRLFTQQWVDETFQKERRFLPFEIVQRRGDVFVRNGLSSTVGNKAFFAPEEVAALILLAVKGEAEEELGRKVRDVVFTVPAFFTNAERQALKDAATIAGLNARRLVHDTTAAAVGFAHAAQLTGEKKLLVIDAGASSTGAAVIFTENADVFEVVATAGDARLGAIDCDRLLADKIAADFDKEHGTQVSSDATWMGLLQSQMDLAKTKLYRQNSRDDVRVPIVADGFGGAGLRLFASLTHADVTATCAPLFSRFGSFVERVLADANITDASGVDHVVLTGGGMKLLAFRKALSATLGGSLLAEQDTVELVLRGAALLSRADDNAPVALDIASFTIGVEAAKGEVVTAIGHGTPVPTKKSLMFPTTKDMQEDIEINVIEAPVEGLSGSHTLGTFRVGSIPPASGGVAVIEVVLELDGDGMLTVTADNVGTGDHDGLTLKPETVSMAREEVVEAASRCRSLFHGHDEL